MGHSQYNRPTLGLTTNRRRHGSTRLVYGGGENVCTFMKWTSPGDVVGGYMRAIRELHLYAQLWTAMVEERVYTHTRLEAATQGTGTGNSRGGAHKGQQCTPSFRGG